MEDATLACRTNDWCLYAVFDGHGGSEVSQGLRRAFPKLLDVLDPEWSDVRIAEELIRAFETMDDTICRQPWSATVGSTASAILKCLHDGRIFVANLGDSRSIMFWGDGRLAFESSDHKPDSSGETARMRRLPDPAQAWEVQGVCRIRGILSVSRAFGDAELKCDRQGRRDVQGSALIAKPDIFAVRVPTRDGDPAPDRALYGLVACDGFWDVFDSRDAASCAADLLGSSFQAHVGSGGSRSPSRSSGNRACRRLVAEALSRGTTDNVSVVLCRLR
jgi:serine/threonine protein phosphatase PrpC